VLIPCIDLQGGQAVQLVHGRRRELAVSDVFGLLEKFRSYPWLHIIDLDAAMGKPANDDLVRDLCAEASATYKEDRWNVYANYTYVDATFRNSLILGSPNNPFADPNGNIFVVPGDHLAGIPNYRFKLGGEYQITTPWKVGADLNVIGSQWLVGDEANQNPKVPAYWVVNVNSSYKITQNLELFGLVRNLFNKHYFVSGTFFETDSFPYLGLTDPRTFLPGMPLAAYVGVRGTLPTGGGVFADAPMVTKARQTRFAGTASAVTNWTGIYLGVNGGYTFGGSKWSDSVTGNSSGSFGTSVAQTIQQRREQFHLLRLGETLDPGLAELSGCKRMGDVGH